MEVSMRIFDLLSQRKKNASKQGQQDVYTYDNLPDAFRVQVAHIWGSSIGAYHTAWQFIHDTMCREQGVFYLGNRPHDSLDQQCGRFLLEGDTEESLDIIDLSFRVIDLVLRDVSIYEQRNCNITQSADDAIEELNHRFKQHCLGYEFVSGEIIRIDSQYIHTAAIKPAIQLLHEAKFKGASEEFLKAHKHYREGKYKEATAEALKAFESTLKSICNEKRWSYESTDTSAKLIRVIFDNKLIPDYLQSHFTSVRGCLEAGLPTVRNKTSGHGQGQEIIELPEHFASYALNLAASNIVFLVNAYKQNS
jgi:hypothetical protein